jgi:hypothetical protein
VLNGLDPLHTGCFSFLFLPLVLCPFFFFCFSPSVLLSSECLDSYGAIFSFSVLYKKRINNPAVNEKLKKNRKKAYCNSSCVMM